MSKAIINKLNKESRRKIAFNYVEDFFNEDINNLQKNINQIAKKSLAHIKERFIEYDINKIEENLKKVGIIGNYKKGLIHGYYRSGEVPLTIKIYYSNAINICLNDNNFFPVLRNKNVSNARVDYTVFINQKNSDVNKTLFEFENKVKEVGRGIQERFNLCYELLSRVRSAEMLMKNWSKAYKYLPEDIKVEEPQKLSLSERFEML